MEFRWGCHCHSWSTDLYFISVSDIFSQTSQVSFMTAVIITFNVVLESSTLKFHSKQKKITAVFHIYLKNVFVLS